MLGHRWHRLRLVPDRRLRGRPGACARPADHRRELRLVRLRHLHRPPDVAQRLVDRRRRRRLRLPAQPADHDRRPAGNVDGEGLRQRQRRDEQRARAARTDARRPPEPDPGRHRRVAVRRNRQGRLRDDAHAQPGADRSRTSRAAPAFPVTTPGTSTKGTYNIDVLNRVGNSAPFFVFPLANPYLYSGNDVIDAHLLDWTDSPATTSTAGSLRPIGVTIFGGPGNDTIIGSQTGDQLAGGSGDDTILGQRGEDIIYGDSGFNVNLITRELSVATLGNGPDRLPGREVPRQGWAHRRQGSALRRGPGERDVACDQHVRQRRRHHLRRPRCRDAGRLGCPRRDESRPCEAAGALDDRVRGPELGAARQVRRGRSDAHARARLERCARARLGRSPERR